jgi:hypothetical protein
MPDLLTEGGGPFLLESDNEPAYTTADLISEVEEHLMGGDRDELNFLGADIADTDTTLTVEMPLSGIAEGSYLSIDLEVLYVKSVDETSQVATVRRGMLGSEPASHSSDIEVYVNPIFTHWSIWRALNVEISSLSAADNGLFAVSAFELTTLPVQVTYDVPAVNLDLRSLLEIRWDDVGAQRAWPRIPLRNVQMIRNLTTDTGTSGLSFRIDYNTSTGGANWVPGRRMVIRYAGDFTPLALDLADDAAATTGLGQEMIDIPALGAAARLMGVREAKRTFVERSVDTRRAAEVPAGSSARAYSVLMQIVDRRIKSEADRLRQLWPDAF